MGLFTDKPLSTIEELTEQDSQLTDVASTEGIDVTWKLVLAHYELRIELETLLKRFQTFGTTGLGVGHVVDTPPLKLWHEFLTLKMVYSDAYFSQLNDRYKKRRDQYHSRGIWAYEKLIQTGIGMVTSPLPRPEPPNILPSQGSLPGGIYYVTMTWVNSAIEESAPAMTGSILITEEPLGELDPRSMAVAPPAAPATATGWNVFVGTSSEQLILQNPQPLAIGEVWLAPGELATQGQRPGTGQSPNFYRSLPRMFQRG